MIEKNILVLFSFRSHKKGYIEMLFDRLSTHAKGSELNLHRGSLKDLHISVENNRLQVEDALTGKNLDDFAALYFELWYKSPQQALAAAIYADRHNIPFFSRELLHTMPLTKVGEIAKLADGDIPLPRTFTSSNAEIRKVFKDNPPINYPLVVKAADGYGGKNNFLVKNYKELAQILRANSKICFIVQEFIPNDCDYRCLVLGGEIKLVLKRTRNSKANTHLNNTSAGAEGKVIELSELSMAAQEAVLAGAHRLGREQFCGVDLMIHKDSGEPYILEVNQTPQIEIGAEIDKKMSALLSYISRLAEGAKK